jgi:hypothetical protein
VDEFIRIKVNDKKMSSSAYSKCRHCNFIFHSNIVPCPKCGKNGKDVFVEIFDSVGAVIDYIEKGLQWLDERRYYKTHRKQQGLMIGLTILLPIIDVIQHPFGLILGILGGLYCYFLNESFGGKIWFKGYSHQPA